MNNSFLAATNSGLRLLPDEEYLYGYDSDPKPVTFVRKQEKTTWIVSANNQIYVSGDLSNWKCAGTVEEKHVRCLEPISETLMIGTSEAHLYRMNDSHLESVASFNDAPNRDNWYTPWGGAPDVRSMTAVEPDELFVNVHVGGILRLQLGDNTATPTIDIDADVHQVRHDGKRNRLLAATARGLATSPDRGESWTFHTIEKPGTYMRAVAMSEEYLFVTSSSGAHPDRAGIFRTPVDQPGKFEKIHNGLPDWFSKNINTHCLISSGGTVVFGTADGNIFISENNGNNWQLLTEHLSSVTCLEPV